MRHKVSCVYGVSFVGGTCTKWTIVKDEYIYIYIYICSGIYGVNGSGKDTDNIYIYIYIIRIII